MSAPVAVAVIAGTLIAGAALLQVSAGVEARHRAAGVAEVAALAAADARFGWLRGDPCTVAARVITTADALLTTCEVQDFNVLIEVSVSTLTGKASAQARAGVRESLVE